MQLNTANKLHPLEHPATLNCSRGESTRNTYGPHDSEAVIAPESLQQGESCSDSFPPGARGRSECLGVKTSEQLPTLSSTSKS